ncbi:MAG TPA: hypothetical protein DCY20_08110 [Firmicutes bacterium]|nr:hypothetical protein [Bacillota bacterium]
MKKWSVWVLMIGVCTVALHSLYKYIMFTPLEADMEATALIIFVPIFFVICICNIMVHLYALIIGLVNRNHFDFLSLQSFVKPGMLNWIGLFFLICYSYDLVVGVKLENSSAIIWNILAIVVTLFYVSWFNTFAFRSVKK